MDLRGKKKPAGDVFGTLEDLAERTAKKICKEIDFKFEGKEVRVDPDCLQPIIQILPHIIKNAVDHGLEASNSRGDKPAVGSLVLTVKDEGRLYWIISIKDDGKGVDGERLAEKAIEMGVKSAAETKQMNYKQKCELLFTDNISSADEVTDLSGRGVGMAAVKEAVESTGGVIEIISEQKKGTTFLITIPKKSSTSKNPQELFEAMAVNS